MPDPLYLYAVGYAATRTTQADDTIATDLAHNTGCVVARSDAEATGLILAYAEKQCPAADGWNRPSVMAKRASDEAVKAAFAGIPAEAGRGAT